MNEDHNVSQSLEKESFPPFRRASSDGEDKEEDRKSSSSENEIGGKFEQLFDSADRYRFCKSHRSHACLVDDWVRNVDYKFMSNMSKKQNQKLKHFVRTLITFNFCL